MSAAVAQICHTGEGKTTQNGRISTREFYKELIALRQELASDLNKKDSKLEELRNTLNQCLGGLEELKVWVFGKEGTSGMEARLERLENQHVREAASRSTLKQIGLVLRWLVTLAAGAIGALIGASSV